jgi:hypothetical protein
MKGVAPTLSAVRVLVGEARLIRAYVLNIEMGGGPLDERHEVVGVVSSPTGNLDTGNHLGGRAQVSSPWGSNNRDSAALYQDASGGECSLVIDKAVWRGLN